MTLDKTEDRKMLRILRDQLTDILRHDAVRDESIFKLVKQINSYLTTSQ